MCNLPNFVHLSALFPSFSSSLFIPFHSFSYLLFSLSPPMPWIEFSLMGFLRRLFGGKKHHNPPPSSDASKPSKDKKTWSFVKHSTRYKPSTLPTTLNNNSNFDPSTSSSPFPESLDANKHAIAVAAATAAVAEAALAAAHAAAEVVRLTSSTGCASSLPAAAPQSRRVANETTAAAVKIQSAFRGYLVREKSCFAFVLRSD